MLEPVWTDTQKSFTNCHIIHH